MMLADPNTLWAIAQIRQDELLKDLHKRQLLRELAETRHKRPRFWRQLSRRLGSSMMAVGHRLQAQQQLK